MTDEKYDNPISKDGESSVRPDSPKLSTLKKLLFTMLLVAGPLISGEIICRLTGAGAQIGTTNEISDWHHSPDGNHFWIVRANGYNEDGMRDREHSVSQTPGTHKIVFLGDSVTKGYGVARHESYPFLFESFMKQINLPVEVFNFSVSGWSTLQQVTAYNLLIRKYQPNHIFLGFCLNDVAEMHNNLQEPPPAILSVSLRYSALLRWLIQAKEREISEVRELFDPNPSQAVEDGWRRVFGELDRLNQITQADHCALSVVILPFRFQLLSSAPAPLAQERLKSWCRQKVIPCIDMLSVLKNIGTRSFIDESHLSLTGAKAVAQELLRWGKNGCMMCGLDVTDVQESVCPRCNYPMDH